MSQESNLVDEPEGRLSRVFCGLLILAVIAFFMLTIQELPRGDEAMFFLQSRIIADGGLPYRDFFHVTFPGGFYLGALIIKLAGSSFLALRMAAFLALVSGLWAVYQIGKSYLDARLRFPALAWLMLMIGQTANYNYHLFSAVASIWALFCLVRFLQRQQRGWLFGVFLLAGVAGVITQSRGILVTIALVAALIPAVRVLNIRLMPSDWLKAVLLPLVLPYLLLAIQLGATGTWDAFFRDTFAWLLQGHYSATSTHLYFDTGLMEMWNMLVAPGKRIVWQNLPMALFIFTVAWLPVLGILWAMQVLAYDWCSGHRRSWRPSHWVLLAVCVVAMALSVSTLSYSKAHHIAMTGLPGLFLGFLALQALFVKKKPAGPRMLGAVITLWTLTILAVRIGQTLPALNNPANWLASYGTVERQYLVSGSPVSALQYAMAVEAIRQLSPEGAPILVYSSSPELYFLADRKPVGRFLLVYPVLLSEEQIRELRDTLVRQKPLLAVDDRKMERLYLDHRFKRYSREQVQLPALTDYINAHYQAFPLDPFTLYRRKTSDQTGYAADPSEYSRFVWLKSK
ncbi:MAG TPA: glycosyltransferase family 39 protein [Coleofasciculaceae cyanobacterium]